MSEINEFASFKYWTREVSGVNSLIGQLADTNDTARSYKKTRPSSGMHIAQNNSYLSPGCVMSKEN